MVKYNNTPCLLKLTDVILVFLLLTLNRFHTFSSVSIVDFEQVNVSRGVYVNNWNKKAKSPKLVLIQGKNIKNQYPVYQNRW